MQTPPKSSKQLRGELKEALKREAREKKSKRQYEIFKIHEKWKPDPTRITLDQAKILAKKHDAKGFTRKALAQIGVPWPPPPSWKIRLINAVREHHAAIQPNNPQPESQP